MSTGVPVTSRSMAVPLAARTRIRSTDGDGGEPGGPVEAVGVLLGDPQGGESDVRCGSDRSIGGAAVFVAYVQNADSIDPPGSPGSPFAPADPVAPVGPVAPALALGCPGCLAPRSAPVGPVAPVGPAGPVGPCGPVDAVDPVCAGRAGIDPAGRGHPGCLGCPGRPWPGPWMLPASSHSPPSDHTHRLPSISQPSLTWLPVGREVVDRVELTFDRDPAGRARDGDEPVDQGDVLRLFDNASPPSRCRRRRGRVRRCSRRHAFLDRRTCHGRGSGGCLHRRRRGPRSRCAPT